MKKLLALLLTAALLLSGCAFRTVAQDVEKVLETAPEMEPVETVTVCLHSHSLIYPDGTEEEQIYEFDNRSFPLSCEYYLNGQKTAADTYTVDEYGNILTVVPNHKGSDILRYSYTYGEDGQILTQQAFRNDSPDYTVEYIYGDAGTLAKKIVTSFDGFRTETLYDGQGRETELLEYKEETLLQRTVTEYTGGGRHRLTVYDSNGEILRLELYEFDEKASCETALLYDAQRNPIGSRRLYFDTYGHKLKEETFDAYGEMTLKECWYYLDHVKIDFVEATEPRS